MRTIWRIFTRDFRRILRNPVAVVVTLGVAVIPSLYAWFNILANWDPYSATGNLKVAVANEDKGTDSDLTGKLSAGEQVVEQLKKNDQLGWTFVDAEDALQGVQSGEYYAAIVLPSDFSANLVNSVTGSGERPKIKYYVNEKKNAIAPKITDTGATTIDSQINSTFVATVSDAVVEALTKSGKIVQDKTQQSKTDIVTNLNDVIGKIDKVRGSISDIQGTLRTTDRTIADAKRTLAALRKQVDAAAKASKRSAKLLAQAQSATQQFTETATSSLDAASVKLSNIGVRVNTSSGLVVDKLSAAQNSVNSVIDAYQRPIDQAAALVDDLKTAMNEAGISRDDPIGQAIWAQIDQIDAKVSEQQKQVEDFRKGSNTFIDSGKDAVTNLSDAVTDGTDSGLSTIGSARATLTGTVLPGLNGSLNSFAMMSGTMSGTLESLSGTIDQSDSLLTQLSDTIDQAKTTLSGTDRSLQSLTGQLDTVRTDVASLDSSAQFGKVLDALDKNRSSIGQFMSSPVALTTKVVYPIANYGSAVTPFYSNLALWVGGFVLIAIYKLEVDREGIRRMSVTQAYLGRWLLFVLVGFMQAVIAMVGDLVLGIQCEHPLLLVLAGVFCSFVYVNIIYALAVAFRHIGKAVAVILVIMQIPGASGLYPIEMMPDFFRNLYPWLPFTYGINAMRGAIAGVYGNDYWVDMGHLALYLPAAWFVGLIVRRYALNLNALFDRRLGDTDLMITEHGSIESERLSLASVFGEFSDSGEFRDVVKRRAHRFFARYPQLIRSGLALLIVLPFIFLILLFAIPAKITMLSLWIASIIVIDTYLIVVEYMRDRYARQLGASAMTADQFRDAIMNGYVGKHGQPRRSGLQQLFSRFGADTAAGASVAAVATATANGTAAADVAAAAGGEATTVMQPIAAPSSAAPAPAPATEPQPAPAPEPSEGETTQRLPPLASRNDDMPNWGDDMPNWRGGAR